MTINFQASERQFTAKIYKSCSEFEIAGGRRDRNNEK
jgi:hypothetical protein